MKIHAVQILFNDRQDRDSKYFGVDLIKVLEASGFEASMVNVIPIKSKQEWDVFEAQMRAGQTAEGDES